MKSLGLVMACCRRSSVIDFKREGSVKRPSILLLYQIFRTIIRHNPWEIFIS